MCIAVCTSTTPAFRRGGSAPGRRCSTTGPRRCATCRRCGCTASPARATTSTVPSTSRSTPVDVLARAVGSDPTVWPVCPRGCIRAAPRRASIWRRRCSRSPPARVTRRLPSRCSRTPASPAAPRRRGWCDGSRGDPDCPGGGSCWRSSRTSPPAPSRCSSIATSPASSDHTGFRRAVASASSGEGGAPGTAMSSIRAWALSSSSTGGSVTSSSRTAGTTWTGTSTVPSTATSPSGLGGARSSIPAGWPVP